MVRLSLLYFSLIVGNVLARPTIDMHSQGLQVRREATNSAPLKSELMRRAKTPPPSPPPSSPKAPPLSLPPSSPKTPPPSSPPPSSPVSSTGSHKGDDSDNEEEQEEYLREEWEVTADVAAALAKEMDALTAEQLTRRSIDTSKSEVDQYLERRLPPFPSLLTIARFFRKKPDTKNLLFWSKVKIGTAKKFGNTKNLQLLSDLMKGGTFEDWTKQKVSWTQKAPWWERLSAGMAVKAAMDKKEVWVMIPRSAMMTTTTVWNRIERPHLQKRDIKINWVDEKGVPIPEAEIKWYEYSGREIFLFKTSF